MRPNFRRFLSLSDEICLIDKVLRTLWDTQTGSTVRWSWVSSEPKATATAAAIVATTTSTRRRTPNVFLLEAKRASTLAFWIATRAKVPVDGVPDTFRCLSVTVTESASVCVFLEQFAGVRAKDKIYFVVVTRLRAV